MEQSRAGQAYGMAEIVTERSKLSFRAGRLVLAVVLVSLAALLVVWVVVGLLAPRLVLPGGFQPPLREVFDSSPSPNYPLGASGVTLGDDYTNLHIDVVSLDESTQQLTLRVAGKRVCAQTCPAEELLLVAVRPDEGRRADPPPLATVELPAHAGIVQSTVQLPVQEQLIQYPFDTIELLLGVALQQVGSDNVSQPVAAADAATRLQLTLQERLSQMRLGTPVPVDPSSIGSPTLGLEYVAVEQLSFERQDGIKLMTILLLALIAATGLYTVLRRSLHDMALNFGGLILGVWSVRAILIPSGLTGRTGVDIALMLVIMIQLVILSVRAARILTRYKDQRAARQQTADHH